MASPRLSVIVPCFNQGHFLATALKSIFSQNYPDLEVIVADGGSTDNSIEVIKSYEQQIALWKSEPDGGQSAAINWGVSHSTGEIVCWLNSDDYFLNRALLHVASAAIRHPDCGLYIGNGLRLDVRTDSLRPYCPHPLSFNRHVLRFGGLYIHQPSMFFRRKTWMDVGGLDVTLNYCMDWDVVLRISSSSKVLLINEFLAVTREYGGTKTTSGGLERVLEVARMTKKHTGQEFSIGTMAMLLDTLLDAESGVTHEFDCFRHLYQARRVVGRALSNLTGRPDHFPTKNDPDVETYVLSCSASIFANAQRKEDGPIAVLFKKCREALSDFGVAVTIFRLRLAMTLGLCTSNQACTALRAFRLRFRFLRHKTENTASGWSLKSASSDLVDERGDDRPG